MSREENWKTRFREMQDASEKIVSYCSDSRSADDFGSDQKTVDACIRNFQILGDAAKKVPVTIQSEFPDVPWKSIKGMRDAAGVRWLHRKRDTASSRLKREATWEEAVSEYKDYLRRKLKNPKIKTKGMDDFKAYLKRLEK